ncbi:hypothetical protein EUX98_g7908 [Antrodiella citrinella]|uniref:F-box domain-containing protein n=1 Tax=Antrodiella citrinella TaxID=2447956 RepID=A0A4S4MJ97_9APHY|nr:hypothetical protein EUX98_g7908 [Antrodiella citrinella]
MLPTNIWERIIDVLAYSGAGGSRIPDRPSLSACSMVCKSWQQRARSHLCQIVRVSSRDQLLSFVAFLSSSPHLCTLVQHLTFHGYSHEENILSEDDSWVSSAPLLFPALPRLHAVAFINVDFSYQHAIFDKAFGKLKFTSNIKSLAFTHYRDMSMITFSRFTHLAHVLRAEAITFHSCTFSSDVASGAVTRNSRIAYWTLTATTAAIISTWSKILYALRACDFVGVKINLQAFGVVWNWDEHTPETWKAVDDVLAQHYTALRYLTVKLQVPTFTLHGPPHRVLSSHYGCVDDIVYALFPQTLSVKRVMFEKSCFDPSCRKTFETISVPP